MGVKERRLRDRIRRSNDIIDAAETVLFSKGIHNATMDDIAEEVELGKATLYVYYKSKDEILLAIQERAINKLAEAFTEAASKYQKGYDKVKAIGEAYFRFAAEYPNYYQFISLFETIHSKIDAEKSMQNVMKVNSVLNQNIQIGIDDGSIRSDLRREVLAKVLWGICTGILQMIDVKGEAFETYLNIKGRELIDCLFELTGSGIEKI